MKSWKCPQCANQHQTEDNIKFCICKKCLTEMKPAAYNYKKETEVAGDGKRDCFKGD